MELFEHLSRSVNRLIKESQADIYSYMHSRIVKQFKDAGKGGTARGVHWKFFTPKYVRKDGSVNYGYRYTYADDKHYSARSKINSFSMVMQNRGNMRNGLLLQKKVTQTRLELSNPQEYAEYQNRMRPFMFFMPEEEAEITRRIGKRLVELINAG